jgi:hypothetical protein
MKILIKAVYSLFFLSIFPNWFHAQNLKFKEIAVDGEKIKLDNLNWKYGSFSRDFLLSDTAAFYKLFCKVEDENPNYQIPTSSELQSLYNGEATLPTRNVSCPKSYTCMQTSSNFGKLIGIASSDKNLLFPLAIDLDLWKEIYIGENKINHPHKCENCSYYTKKQRENFPCQVCKNTNETYCNETITCPICKGTGIRKSKSKVIKIKDIYLKSKEDVHYIYFDSPTDFGIYDLINEKKVKFDYLEDSINFLIHYGTGKKINNILTEFEEKKTEERINLEKITEFLRIGNLAEARNVINSLNFPNKQIRNEYDYRILTKSENSMQSGNYFEGIGFAELLYFPEYFTIKKSIWDQIPESTLVDLYKETSGEIKNKIKFYLSNYFDDKYKNLQENYPVEQTNRFIEDNKDLLKKLPVGNHDVLIKRNGELVIDNQLRQERPINYNENEFKYGSLIRKKDFFGFDVLINGKMILNVTENNILIDNSEKLILNSDKTILMKPNEVIYASNWFNTNPRHDEIGYYTPEKYKTINSSLKIDNLKKSEYVRVQKQKSTIFVNNKEVGQIDKEIITGEGKLSKRIPKVIWRSFSIVFWSVTIYVSSVLASN